MSRYDAAWRGGLLARLAAERAHFWGRWWGLDEATLTESVLEDGWRVKDALPHIAMWDALTTHQMQIMLEGRREDLVAWREGIEARNEAWHEQHADLSLSASVAMALKERGGFLAMLDRVSDEALHRRFVLPSGSRTQMRTWARRRFLHDGIHAKALTTWRGTLPPEVARAGHGPSYILRAILKATRKDFMKTAVLVPDAARETMPVCGVWSLKNLVGHLTDWEKVAIDGLRPLVAGETPTFAYQIKDFNAFNAQGVAAREGQSWDAVWQDFVETRETLLGLFDALPAAALAHEFVSPWGRPTTGYRWVTIYAAHATQHAVDVRRAVGLHGWPKYLMGK